MAVGRREPHRTRAFATGTFAFTVDTASTEDRQLVESLFRDVPPPSSDGRTITGFSLLREDVDLGSWAVGGPYMGDHLAPTLGDALERLMSAVNLCALDAEPEHLHLHAGAAAKGGRVVIVAARRNTGKTTTTAHLVARGWGFVTDETVRLHANASDVTGFPKPLSIKPDGIELVDHLAPWMVPSVGDGPVGGRFVPVSASGASVVEGGAPHTVVLLRRPRADDSATGAVARPLHPADAVVGLMAETLDPERFGSAAFQLAKLTATCHCYELTMGTPTETVDEIEARFRLDPLEPLEVRVLPASDAFSSGVVSVAVGDRAVVHDTISGRIFALDAGGARVWSTLGGWSVDDEIDLAMPVMGPFVAQLRSLGVLAGAA